jgi:hypothetical protein
MPQVGEEIKKIVGWDSRIYDLTTMDAEWVLDFWTQQQA